MNFQGMRVKTRLAIGFGVLTGALLVVAALSIEALHESNQRFTSFVEGINARAELAASVRTAVDRRAIAARNLVLVTKPADLEIEKAAVVQAHEDVQRDLRKFNELVSSATDVPPEVRARVAEINRVESQYGPVALDIVDLALKGKHAEAIAHMNDECRPLLAALVKATQDYSDMTHAREAQLVAESAAHYAFSRMLLLGVCAFAVFAAMFAGIAITRSILRALGAEPDTLSEVAKRVAEGDLRPVADAGNAPANSVLASMSTMQKNLVELIGNVRASADSIATGSSQIATGNVDLSTRTEEQAASLEETASSVEQLTSTVRQNAEHAQHANTLSADASAIAQQGNAAVSRMIETMSDISARSGQIAEITGMIEGIAFQTNILALNAAVEAARAGEEGRGFAVVAAEVRSLAQRSSSAAKEIKELINASVGRITEGSKFAGDAGATMTDVLHAVSKVRDIMNEIAAASNEQSRGIEQLSQAIAQMDQVTQQNAALVEEAAAASQSLDDQGRRLTDAVSFFRLTTH
ncbi:methyl-accepting chemotaxis protein (plasmid) [Caballeronia sp. NK8]|uniref:methyl-accepting chemotaxis protein n=1 Tax=Caballeronia sp. NK8 TaxID=140098 RepID=UPI001BB48DCE|nr:methyl-accepting chemotaxis protein [Caballeronia sp. NK8]BCQ27584.1 methyl-accepting chemotaxis protein [Caballeronia sp. NK8]